jgi:hypothetical protein
LLAVPWGGTSPIVLAGQHEPGAPRSPERTRISCYATPDRTACAAFFQGKPHGVRQRHQPRQEIRGTWDEKDGRSPPLLCISEARPPERNRLRRRRNRSLAGECPETKRFRSRRSPCKDCKVEGRRPRPISFVRWGERGHPSHTHGPLPLRPPHYSSSACACLWAEAMTFSATAAGTTS